jgi:hypothetical protein
MIAEKQLLDVATNVVLDCQELPSEDQLVALQLAWWNNSVEYSQCAGRDTAMVPSCA